MDCRFVHGVDRLACLRRSVFCPGRPARLRTVRTFAAEGSRQPWEFGRFLQTVLFFNDPLQSLLKNFTRPAEKPSASTVVEERSGGITRVFGSMESSSPIVLFGGASEIGRCMLEGMMKKGMSVRAVVANAQQTRSDLENLAHDPASILDLVEWNRGMPTPRTVARPKAIVVCGAHAPYAKILQSIVLPGIDVYDPSEGIVRMTWGSLDDVVMGGCSESSLTVQQGKGDTAEYAAVFSGNITSANNGGFASVRTKNLDPPLDLKDYDGLKLRVRGDGQRYKFMLRTTDDWDSISFCQSFDTKEGWQDIMLPFKEFFPVFRAKSVKPAPSLNLDRISSLQIMLSKFEYDGDLNPTVRMGRFELPIESITSFVDNVKTPRVLFIGGGDEENPLKNMTEQYCIINVDAEQEVPMKDSTLVAFSMACLTAEEAAKATFNEKNRSIPTESLTFDALSENFSRE